MGRRIPRLDDHRSARTALEPHADGGPLAGESESLPDRFGITLELERVLLEQPGEQIAIHQVGEGHGRTLASRQRAGSGEATAANR